MDALTNARRDNRRVWFIVGILMALFLLVAGFMGGRAMAYGPAKAPKHSATCRYNAAHKLISGSPSYCKQSNWSCVGTDGACVNGKETVTYPSGCPQKSKTLNCGAQSCGTGYVLLSNKCVQEAHSCAAPSTFDGCVPGACHEGYFVPHTFCPGGVYNGGHAVVSGAKKVAYASTCDSGCAPTHTACTPDGQLTLNFLGCVGNGVGKFDHTNSCGSVMSTSTGKAKRCDTGSSGGNGTNPTEGSGSGSGNGSGSGGSGKSGGGGGGGRQTCTITTTYGTPEWTSCSAKGVEIGYQPWTAKNSCGGTSSGTNPVEQHTSTACQPAINHQCAYAMPGYAQSEHCLTSPLGGYTDCGNWSAPYYDPYDCPIPTPIGN